MKLHALKRHAAAGTIAVSALGVVMFAAPAANAAATGSLTFSPTSGNDTTLISVTTSAKCSGGTNLQVYLSGGNFAANTSISPNSPQSNFQTTASGALIIPISNNLAQLAQSNGVSLVTGKYTFDAICKNAFGATVFDDFQGQINISSVSPVAWSVVSSQQATTTTVTSSVASPVAPNTSVTFTATVSPAASGTVQFMDGTTALGAPVTVTNGVATFTTSTLASGGHTIGAAFTSSDPNFANSSATGLAFSVNAGPQATTTGLAVSPSGAAGQGQLVTLTANITPASAVGSVVFSDGTTALGNAVPVVNGVATLTTSTLAIGAHSFTAAFTATDATKFGNSATATPIPYQVTATPPPTATESITTTVVPGALVISVPDNQVTLPSPVLDNAGDMFTTSGALKPVTVTDNRAGNPGWTVNGQVSDFSDGQAHGISGENLGWSPNVVDHSTAQTITLGGVVTPGNGIAFGDKGTNGLAGSHALAIASAGAGLGTAHLAAGLNLNVPTTTVAGTYVATLTLTAI